MPSIRKTYASFAFVALAAGCSAAPTGPSATEAPARVEAIPTSSTSSVTPLAATLSKEGWRRAMSKTPLPKAEGCFFAAPMSTVWEEVPCGPPVNNPYPPAHGPTGGSPGPLAGNDSSGDLMSAVPSTITWAEGSFPVVIGAANIDSGGVANTYTLQLDSNRFDTPECNGINGCQGWQQFVYDAAEQALFIQYWLVGFGNNCPSGWKGFEGDCYRSSSTVPIADQPISRLGELAVMGVTGGYDAVYLWIEDIGLYTTSKKSVLGLNAGWTSSEFNIFGEGTSGPIAAFTSPTTLQVQLVTDSLPTTGITRAPACQAGSTAFEANNLTMISTPSSCCQLGGESQGIQFTESNIPGQQPLPCPGYVSPPTQHGFMITSDTSQSLAVSSVGGVVQLSNSCTTSKPECTWSYVNGMLLSDLNEGLAINAYGGAQQGTKLLLVHGCNPSLTDCTWTYSHGEFLSDTNPQLAVNSYGGAKNGTQLELVNGCNPSLTDCTFSLHNVMLASAGDTGFNVDAYEGAKNLSPLLLSSTCTPALPGQVLSTDCTFSFHQGMITSDTNSALSWNAYGGAGNLNPVELVNVCSSGISTCTWTWSHGEIITDSSPVGSPLVVNQYGGVGMLTPLKIVYGCNTGLSTCVFDGLYGKN
jgi:hypothetical protein